jgi:DNA polymerase III subunit gamma/tau
MSNPYKISKESNLALKYRPKLFKDLIGQEHISTALQSMIDTRKVHQTLLFFGQSGTGKTSSARVLARYLNCQDIKENDEGHSVPCGECPSCKYDITKHPDVIELNMASDRGIEEARQLVRTSQLSPSYNFRVFILDEIHACTGNALESLLKPLEEPPLRTVWILCTTNPEKLKPTLRGRCRQFEVKPLNDMDCAKLLRRVAKREGVESLTKEQLLSIAQLTGAQPRAALQALGVVLDSIQGNKKATIDIPTLVESVVALPPYKTAITFLTAVYQGNYAKALIALDQTQAKVPFAKMILDYHYKACRYHISPELRSKEYFDKLFYDQIKDFKMPTDLMSAILTRLVRCNSLVTEFQVDANFVIMAATMEIIELVRSCIKSK